MPFKTSVFILLLSASMAAAQSWSVTGPGGGSGSGSASCDNNDGTSVCTRTGQYTTGGGYTTDWGRTRKATADTVTVEGYKNRPRGSADFTRSRNR